MKRSVLISGILLMLLTAGNTTLRAQRGMRDGMDSTRMGRAGRDAGLRHMRASDRKGYPLNNEQIHQGFMVVPEHGTMRGMVPWHGNMRGAARGYQFGMNPRSRFGSEDFRPVQNDRTGIRLLRPGRDITERIPNLTKKQVKEIETLRQQQQAEMKKFRDEISEKMKVMRDDHRKKLMDLLTDEQKMMLEPAGE